MPEVPAAMPTEQIDLHPIDAPDAGWDEQDAGDWHLPSTAPVAPEPVIERERTRVSAPRPLRLPEDDAPARATNWLAVVIASLLALALGAAIGLAFPQVMGASKGELRDAQQRASLQERARKSAEKGTDQLESKVDQLEDEKSDLQAQLQTAKSEQTKAEQAQTQQRTQIDAAERKLATAATTLSDAVAQLQLAADSAGNVPQVNQMVSRTAVTLSDLGEQQARLGELDGANLVQGVNMVERATSDIATQIGQTEDELVACTDKACRITAVTGDADKLAAVTAKLQSDLTALIAKAKQADTASKSTTPEGSAQGNSAAPDAQNPTADPATETAN
jgi:hypothetical protein